MKSFTDLGQSKKLSEILPLKSADMYYLIKRDDCRVPWEEAAKDDTNVILFTKEMMSGTLSDYKLPCWSLPALMNLLPSEFTEKGKYSETTYKIDIRKYTLTENVDVYQIAYGNYKFYEDGNSSWKDLISTGEKEDLIDAAFDIICWLKNNNKL